MELKIIKTKKDYQAYLDWVNELFDKKVSPNSPEGEELQVALLLIKQYEDAHFPGFTDKGDKKAVSMV
jgi:HTH-type transcriptional regulator/antitoxin HigA